MRRRRLDVLCLGHASYDLIFTVSHHPAPDEKCIASAFLACGGGPAANAAVAIARLGLKSAFAGYLGADLYGDKHFWELQQEGVIVDFIVRGSAPTPLSAVLVKPDGKRALVNYRGETRYLPENALDFSLIVPKVILLDGHEPLLSASLVGWAKNRGIATVLDAGSLHPGTEQLMNRVDYLVCSEKFAYQYSQDTDAKRALHLLGRQAERVVITLGERGLIWQKERETGEWPAFKVGALDTTGAGDAFHGAFAACLAAGKGWPETLRYASAVAALCCTEVGARPGIPTRQAVDAFLAP